MIHTSYHSDDLKFRVKANDRYVHVDLGDDIASPFSLALPSAKAQELADCILHALQDQERRAEIEREVAEKYAEAD